MSDEVEKTCPLCAEEMDLTDQQLKPCKCGYQICVWCWHHIMEMAEKDETEGRCPACRTPYNKAKIVGTTANCGRLVAEMNMERKLKSQKAKTKNHEGRKQLSSVRVVQRNLVYIVGLPLNLADENLLHRKEYFGQYGKVLKASISRTAAGSIQQFANSTCSVYITYSKEEEAVRCIQFVHGFVLEGKSLRACFGTTKYCHAWLRNMPCSNPDCLYLHEIGSQEDSFTKHEIISAYTRTRVQPINVASSNIQRRSGNVLPPPADDCGSDSSAALVKPTHKPFSDQNRTCTTKGSPPDKGSGTSFVLPASASCGTNVAVSTIPSGSLECSNEPDRQKIHTSNGSLLFSTAVGRSCENSMLQADIGKKFVSNNKSCTNQQKHSVDILESKTTLFEGPMITCPATTSGSQILTSAISKSKDCSIDLYSHSYTEENDITDAKVENLCSSMSLSMNISRHQGLHQSSSYEQLTDEDVFPISQLIDMKSDLWNDAMDGAAGKMQDDLAFLSDKKLKEADPVTNSSYLTTPYDCMMNSRGYLSEHDNGTLDDKTVNGGFLPFAPRTQQMTNKFTKTPARITSNFLPDQAERRLGGGVEGATVNKDCSDVADIGENRIISNILSMDFDSLTSPHSLLKVLGRENELEETPKKSSLWKIQNRHQSRFSFAKEESANVSVETTVNKSVSPLNGRFLGPNFVEDEDLFMDRFGNNRIPDINFEESDQFFCNNLQLSTKRLSVPKTRISAPPGFSMAGKIPIQDCLFQGRREQPYNIISGNFLPDTTFSIRNQYQEQFARSIDNTGDIDFMDPAILAVGRRRIPSEIESPRLHVRSSSPQFTPESDLGLQLLMQRSLFQNQSQRSVEMGNYVSHHSSVLSRIMEPTLECNPAAMSQPSVSQSRNFLMSNGHSDHSNGVLLGQNLRMTEFLGTAPSRTRMVYNGYEDSRMSIPSLNDLHDGRYGI